MKLTDRRLGMFQINMNFMETQPEIVRAVMGRCIVLNCEMRFPDFLQYTAISPDFEEIKPGGLVPGYNVVVRDNGAEICFERIRVPYTELE